MCRRPRRFRRPLAVLTATLAIASLTALAGPDAAARGGAIGPRQCEYKELNVVVQPDNKGQGTGLLLCNTLRCSVEADPKSWWDPSPDDDKHTRCGAEGLTNFPLPDQDGYPMRNKPWGCLLGRADGKTFYVGKSWTNTENFFGELRLFMNDKDCRDSMDYPGGKVPACYCVRVKIRYIPHPVPVKTKVVEVRASKTPQPTGIQLACLDTCCIEYVSGKWNPYPARGRSHACDAAGLTHEETAQHSQGYPMNAHWGELLGVADGRMFRIGRGARVTPIPLGELKLLMNDADDRDNSGSIRVRILYRERN